MSAASLRSLLRELTAAGIAIVPEAGALRVIGQPGADLSAFQPRIAAHKREILADYAATVRRLPHLPRPGAPPPASAPRPWMPAESVAPGRNPAAPWRRPPLAGQPVAASRPPADWDGALPAGCCHGDLCAVLGPCPHAATRCAAMPLNGATANAAA